MHLSTYNHYGKIFSQLVHISGEVNLGEIIKDSGIILENLEGFFVNKNMNKWLSMFPIEKKFH